MLQKQRACGYTTFPNYAGRGLKSQIMQHCLEDFRLGKARTWEDTFSRCGKIRSKTFPGIAKAMAEQWGEEDRS